MSGIAMWIIGLVMGLIALVGLLFASSGGAHDVNMYITGLLIFGLSVAFIFWLIKAYFDSHEPP